MFKDQYQNYSSMFESYLNEYFKNWSSSLRAQSEKDYSELQALLGKDLNFSDLTASELPVEKHFEAIEYSLISNGKRFRPILALALCEAINLNPKEILPFCLAVEMIHTYSLIHDDLPCMDNDDYRRGKLTNHKVYGEASALLAGDALLTQAFQVIAKNSDWVRILSQRAGSLGMIRGQIIDLHKFSDMDISVLLSNHLNKTAALMRSCGEAVEALSSSKFHLSEFTALLGLSFQIADDVLDSENKNEKQNFVHFLGLEKTKELLTSLNLKLFKSIETLPNNQSFLKELVTFNSQRNQ